jgi:hypothetical protein
LKEHPAGFKQFLQRWEGHVIQVVFARIEDGYGKAFTISISVEERNEHRKSHVLDEQFRARVKSVDAVAGGWCGTRAEGE